MSLQQDRSGASWLRYSHLGLQYTVTMLLGVGAGYWLDARLATGPWLVLAGSLLGIVAATYVLIRDVSRIGR